ncbi:hypothetical protein [Aeromonas caviae]|uniref:hypothetical protein n=1 Tax=Aeromonas caviae TaxID=648 RepID=UPI002B48B330|nr:hypothetical protein [Aeromonas caviae]
MTNQQLKMKSTFEALTAYESQREAFISTEADRLVWSRDPQAGCERIVCDNLHQAASIYNERKDRPEVIEPRGYSLNLVYGKPSVKLATAAATELYTMRHKRLSDEFQAARALYVKAQEAVEQAAAQQALQAQSEQELMAQALQRDADLTARMLAH